MNPETAKPNTNLPRNTVFMGAALGSVFISAAARYTFPLSTNPLIQSGLHAAGGLVLGTGLGLAKSRNGNNELTLKGAILCSTVACLTGLVLNVAFEYVGHPLEELFNSYAKGRELGTAYGDWKEDCLFAAAGSFLGCLVTRTSTRLRASGRG